MGLAVEVGTLAYFIQHDPEAAVWTKESSAAIDAILRREGLDGFTEPETLPEFERTACLGFPYSFLHYLRRAYAYAVRDEPVPDDAELRPEHDDVVDEESMMMDSHLLCHSDCEGYYVPVDFDEPIFDDDVPGSTLGSTQGLMRELRRVAPALGIELADERPTPAAVAALREIDEAEPLWRERLVWWALYESGEISLAHGTLLAFH